MLVCHIHFSTPTYVHLHPCTQTHTFSTIEPAKHTLLQRFTIISIVNGVATCQLLERQHHSSSNISSAVPVPPPCPYALPIKTNQALACCELDAHPLLYSGAQAG